MSRRPGKGLGAQAAGLIGLRRSDKPESGDPTREPPPAYTREGADAVYRTAVDHCFQFLVGNDIDGDILEFGTYYGFTTRILAEYMAARDFGGCLYTYDSFRGFPQEMSEVDRASYEVACRGGWRPGELATEPGVPERIRAALATVLPPHRLVIVEGFFEDVLAGNLPDAKAALVVIDCDLYGSTLFVLRTLIERDILQDGTLIMFDDYNSNRAHPEMGERRALREAFAGQERFAASPYFAYGWHGQVVVVHDLEAPAALAGRSAG